jgi:hypothetical protein
MPRQLLLLLPATSTLLPRSRQQLVQQYASCHTDVQRLN